MECGGSRRFGSNGEKAPHLLSRVSLDNSPSLRIQSGARRCGRPSGECRGGWWQYVRKRWCREHGRSAGGKWKDREGGERKKGTPQGGVISPLLANIYLRDSEASCGNAW